MTEEELKEHLKNILNRQESSKGDPERPWGSDIEADHLEADRLLLDFIDDEEVSGLFEEIDKWYA